MKINVTCEKHNVSMVVVREWSSGGDIEVTVEPCAECIEEAAQQSLRPTPPLALSCECGSLYGVHKKFCPKYKSAGG